MGRVENYLKQVMNNPDEWVLIKKKRGMKSPKAIANERTNITDQVEQMLKLMDIPCSRVGYKVKTHNKIKRGFNPTFITFDGMTFFDETKNFSTTVLGRIDRCTIIIDETQSSKK